MLQFPHSQSTSISTSFYPALLPLSLSCTSSLPLPVSTSLQSWLTSPSQFFYPSHPFLFAKCSHNSSISVSASVNPLSVNPLASRSFDPLHPSLNVNCFQNLLPCWPASIRSLRNSASMPFHSGHYQSINISSSHTPLLSTSDPIHTSLSYSNSPHVHDSVSPNGLTTSTPCRKHRECLSAFSSQLSSSSPSTSMCSPHSAVSPSTLHDVSSRNNWNTHINNV